MQRTPITAKKNRFSLADWISTYRIVASSFLCLALLAGMKLLFAGLLAVSLASDMIDGYIARRQHNCSLRGARLDSIGDALTFSIAALGLWVFEKEFLGHNKVLLLAMIIPYFVQILLAVLRYGKPSSFHTYLAKTAALLQGSFILLLLFFGPLYPLFYATVTITLLEIAEEFVLLFLLKGNETDVKGLYWVLEKRKLRGKN